MSGEFESVFQAMADRAMNVTRPIPKPSQIIATETILAALDDWLTTNECMQKCRWTGRYHWANRMQRLYRTGLVERRQRARTMNFREWTRDVVLYEWRRLNNGGKI